ncbi:hypothetical protein GCM10010339_72080 [Streptomyces alanosinicus]|uniref:Uncharacterized protein n=1 Tax=Streptomyces alanosinicus TaxID=68171 RepID=A0A918YQT6_9ACTN|nr:hypothetical protein GCM10010339_72080 [Streptomyces alanosinicus]
MHPHAKSRRDLRRPERTSGLGPTHGYGGEIESANSSQLRLKPRTAQFTEEQPDLPAGAPGGTGPAAHLASWAQVLLGPPFEAP